MTVKEGWKGRFYEDFEVGDVYEHPLDRTIMSADNIWFTLLTQNTAPLHFRPPLRQPDRVRAPARLQLPDAGPGHGARA